MIGWNTCDSCGSVRVGHWLMCWGIRFCCTNCKKEWTELNEVKR